ncbi:MAG TPA: hypothetical protein DIU00_02790 [Phycisphaerales bacterium]|nr:hypothetical protein [Phycisphaerales bacterium]
MKSAENIKKVIKNLDLDIDTNTQTDQAVLSELLDAQKKSMKQQSAFILPNIRILIMKNPITRVGFTAIVILGALLVIRMLVTPAKEPAERIVKEEGTPETVEGQHFEEKFNGEFSEVRQMAAVGDVKGLATILSEGKLESKLVAANFLAKMGKMPSLGRIPALETLSMHASGKLIVDNRSGSIRLRSTKSQDWLDITEGVLRVHTSQGSREAKLVRVTYDIKGDDEKWEKHKREFADWRQKRADLERELAQLGQNPTKDISRLRERLAKYNETLDGMDEAAYVTYENDRLKLSCPFRHRTAFAELCDGIVRVEWHGHIVGADSVTLLLALAPVRTDGPPPPVPGWRARFDKVYSLDDEEVLRWVRYPFIPERQIYATQEMPYHASKNPPPPGYIAFQWDGKLHPWTIAMHECALGSVLNAIGLKSYEIDGPEKLLGLKLGGDWIARRDVPTDDTLSALERILENGLNRKVRFEKQEVNRDVIIVRGQFKHVPLEGVKRPEKIYIYPDSWRHLNGPEPYSGGGTGSLIRLIKMIGSHFDRPIIFETENLSEITVSYFTSSSYGLAIANYKTREEKEKILESVLKNLSKQTSLEFEYGQRDQIVWFITELSEDE